MSDEFLDLLEHELIAAARRRVRSSASHPIRARRWRADAGALRRGLAVASSAAVVVLVAGVLLLAGRGASRVSDLPARLAPAPPSVAVSPAAARRCHPGAPRTPLLTRTEATPDAATVSLLSDARAVGARAGASLTRRGVFPILGHPTVLYTRYIRVVRLPGGLSVALIPASICGDRVHGGRQPITNETRDLILARVSGHGHSSDARTLGTVRAIDSGHAFFQASPIVGLPGRRGTVILTMVPHGVVAIVCHGTRQGERTGRFVAHSGIVLVDSSTYRESRCGYARA